MTVPALPVAAGAPVEREPLTGDVFPPGALTGAEVAAVAGLLDDAASLLSMALGAGAMAILIRAFCEPDHKGD